MPTAKRGSSRRRAERRKATRPAPEKRPELLLIPGYDPYVGAGDCYFSPEHAERALAFFRECLTHVKGSGQKLPNGESKGAAGQCFELEPWQVCIVSNLFGWLRPDGTRRYRECLIYVPRKNGKTTLIAGLVLFLLLCDGEPGAEIYSAAATEEQARLIFDQAKKMVEAEPEMASRVQCFTGALVYGTSSYKPISAEPGGKHGLNAHGIFIDELHEQPNRELVDTLVTSQGARNQPLTVYITTADYARTSICNEILERAKRVRDRITDDPTFLPVVYEASIDDDWQSEEVWKKANPNYGISVKPEFLRKECKRAIDVPGFTNSFRRLYLNVQTEADVAWLRMDYWDGAPTFDPATLIGRPCWCGLDLASTSDLTAFAMVFPPDDEVPYYAVLVKFWAPREGAMQRERTDRVPYIQWAGEKHITLTEGNRTDYAFVRRDINALRELYDIRQIGTDPWAATQLTQELMGDGFEIEDFRQGFASMTAPSKELERIVVEKQLAHFGNPVLRWMARNVHADMDAAGNVKPDKKKSTEKIDGVVALIMGLGLILRRPVEGPSQPNVYEERGVMVL